MIEKRGSFELAKSLRKFKGQKATLPRKLGNMAKRHFLDGFRKGGFTDETYEQWKPRRKRRGIGFEKTHLIKSGAMRRSIKVYKAVWDYILIGTKGIKYALKHNLGLNGLPQRKFIGDSKQLNKKIEKRLIAEIDKVFK